MVLVLIAVPEFSSEVIGIFCGIILILFGIVRLIGFFSKDLYRLAFQYDLAFGILMVTLGIIILVHPGSLMNFLCIVLGISFLLTDCSKYRYLLIQGNSE